MEWNHRLVLSPKYKTVSVMEVFYSKDGVPWFCGRAEAVYDEDTSEGLTPQESIREQLEQMKEAIDKPILNLDKDFGAAPNFERI
jgi:hypothetical protein